jgi:hypothetical protein
VEKQTMKKEGSSERSKAKEHIRKIAKVIKYSSDFEISKNQLQVAPTP